MRTCTILALAASALVSAAPSPIPQTSPGEVTTAQFNVTKFVFGCTVGCVWSFNVTVEGEYKNHPELTTPVTCSGTLDDVTDYKECTESGSETQSVLAYIVKDTNQLKLQYAVDNLEEKRTYRFYGEQEVYTATGADASLQDEEFAVPETTVSA